MTDLVERLRSLADCDARAGEPLGKCMREAADEIERLDAVVMNIEIGWLRTSDAHRILYEALRWYAGDGSTYDGIDVGQRARAAIAKAEGLPTVRAPELPKAILGPSLLRKAVTLAPQPLPDRSKQP